MSREVGAQLDARLVEHFETGGAAVVTSVVDGSPRCLLAKGIHATSEPVTVLVIGTIDVGTNVAVHTIGEAICAVLGEIASASAEGDLTRTEVIVRNVKDDRPPGLHVEPFALLDAAAD